MKEATFFNRMIRMGLLVESAVDVTWLIDNP
jgi:hypothetical protein